MFIRNQMNLEIFKMKLTRMINKIYNKKILLNKPSKAQKNKSRKV